LVLTAAGASNLGGQRVNEDAYRSDDELGLLGIADGMTTRPAAHVAAETAVRALFEYLTDPNTTSPANPREWIERAIGHINQHMREDGERNAKRLGMAAAFACAMQQDKLLVVGHVGDSRVMRFRNGELERLTADHRRDGKLTRAIGLAEREVGDVSVEVLRAEDGVLLTTAGLTNVLDADTIASILRRVRSPRATVDELINAALRRGAPQNLTCVYGRWRSRAL